MKRLVIVSVLVVMAIGMLISAIIFGIKGDYISGMKYSLFAFVLAAFGGVLIPKKEW
jgi:hypothetical protein